MQELLGRIGRLKSADERRTIESRMLEFEETGKQNEKVFSELCFCLLTANFNAERSIKIQNEIGDGFLKLPADALAQRLKELGHRFPNARAKFIFEARKHAPGLKEKIESFSDDAGARQWLAGNVKGLGYKEASHFLRNTGRKNVAIIDFHIVDLLARHGLIEKPKSKSIPAKKYVEIEKVLEGVCKKTGLSQAELDLYLWYLETGKILK
ncbi:MAG: N-glycosylase/DNA lyase [Candidatus Diapherotrites archaeon]|nr:N-glycosylase/DNA lyase [Candidatus Diapherotrites archaeon]